MGRDGREAGAGSIEHTKHGRTAITRSRADIETWLRNRLADLVEAEPSEIDVRIPVERYGVDSRTLASMAGELEDWIGFQLPSTLLWDYPTIENVAAALSTSASGRETSFCVETDHEEIV